MGVIATALEEVEKLIADRNRHWTRKVEAEDENFWRVPPKAKNACRWCLSGAIARVTKDGDEYSAVLEFLAPRLPALPEDEEDYCGDMPAVLGYYRVTALNDDGAATTAHRRVMAALRSALADAQKEGV